MQGAEPRCSLIHPEVSEVSELAKKSARPALGPPDHLKRGRTKLPTPLPIRTGIGITLLSRSRPHRQRKTRSFTDFPTCARACTFGPSVARVT